MRRNSFLHIRTVSSDTLIITPINFSQFNKNLHCRITKFWVNFYISFNFLIIRTYFPTILTTVVNDHSFEMIICYKVRTAAGSCLYCLKGIELSYIINEIEQRIITLCYNTHAIMNSPRNLNV